jgi:hypothetical protein
MQPLPQLGARDLGGGGVFHQVVDRHAAVAVEPERRCTHADVRCSGEAGRVIVPFLGVDQVIARDHHVVAQLGAAGWGVGMWRRRSPRAIGIRPGCATQVPSWPALTSRSLSARTLASAASLAAASFADRDLRRHAAHREGAAAVAGRISNCE